MWDIIIGIVLSVSKFLWMRSSRVIEKCHWWFISMLIPYYLIILPVTNDNTHALHEQDSFIVRDIFVLFTSKYIYLKSVHSRPKFEPTTSNNTWPHVLISLFRFICSMFFGYLIGLYIFSYPMWWFYTYFKYSKYLEPTVSLFLNKSNKLHP